MAINPSTLYTGKIVAPSTPYPYGSAQDITVTGDGTGTPWLASQLNDIYGHHQALLKSAGIVPSGSPDEVGTSQYLQSIVELASGRANTYTAGGTASIMTLTAFVNQEPIQSYYVGLTVKFTPIVNNTGVMTVNINGLGAIVVKDIFGNNLVANDIRLGIDAEITYDGVTFVLHNAAIETSGSFTPGLYGVTSGTGVRPTYTGQIGQYVRHGNLVFLEFSVSVSSIAGISGDIRFDGMPFDIQHTAAIQIAMFNVMQGTNFNLTTNYHSITLVDTGTSDLKAFLIKQRRDIEGSGVNINFTDTNLTNTSFFQLVGFYRIL